MANGEQKWSGGSWRVDHGEGLEPQQPERPFVLADRNRAAQRDSSQGAALKKVPLLPLFLLGGGILLAAVIVASHFSGSSNAAAQFQDLGAGISRATGLRGDLSIRWQGKAEYKLKFVPLDPLQSAGFSFVASNPPRPLWVNIRLLDQTGFALCSKQIFFPFDPASAASARSRTGSAGGKAGPEDLGGLARLTILQAQGQQSKPGEDTLQNQLNDDGKVAAFTAQGLLPCAPDLYKHISYWDFTTNFPTLGEQDALMKGRADALARAAAAARAAQRRNSAHGYKSGFVQEGDDRISAYDPSTGMLQVGPGRSFLVMSQGDRAAADSWAANTALVHYRCDQYANCSISRAGGMGVITARSLQ
jgi:hypothetical protein